MRVRRLDWGPGEEASASSSFDGGGGHAETAPASGASGLVARMAVQRAGSIGNPLGLGRSWSANDRAGPSPLSETSGPSGPRPHARLVSVRIALYLYKIEVPGGSGDQFGCYLPLDQFCTASPIRGVPHPTDISVTTCRWRGNSVVCAGLCGGSRADTRGQPVCRA